MPAIAALTTGVIERIMVGEEIEKPVLQILGAKKISGTECERLRLLVSDGKFFNSFAMLATQLNHLHSDGKLEEYTIVQLDKYITSVVNKNDTNSKRVLIILDLTVLNGGSEVGKKIGNPVTYTESSSSGTNQSRQTPVVKPAPKLESKPSYCVSINQNNNTTLNQSNNSFGITHPIASLSPYQNKWVIKARVTSKSAIRTWSNAKGEGKLFSMDLMDESGEIRATAFKEQCEKFFDMIEADHVYFISKCQLKPANKQFTTIKNDYEMTFTPETIIQPCDEEDSGIPEIKYELVPISQIMDMEPKAVVDTIGICKVVGELQTFTSRTTNKEFKKRELTLVDSSNAAVNLTLWGDEAVNFDGYVQPVILVKSARLTEFNGGKSLSMGSGATLKINPDIKEGHQLRGWFDNGGGENISTLVSARSGAGSFNTEWLTFHEAQAKKLGTGDKADYFQVKAVVHVTKTANCFYKACPQAECNKKVVDQDNGHYRCERCNAVFSDFKYRLLLSMSIADWTSNRWVTCFSDVGEQLLNRTSQEIGATLDGLPAEDEEARKLFAPVHFKSYIFKLRSKVELYGDMSRNKLTIQSVSPVNYKEYNKYLIKNITGLTGVNKI